ncbi:MAG: hypothetical protein ABSG25_06780, partial [Bryobacteraceae bacterium]
MTISGKLTKPQWLGIMFGQGIVYLICAIALGLFFFAPNEPHFFHIAFGVLSVVYLEIARNSVESQRLSTLIDYATAAPFAIDFLETAFAIEDSN